MSQGLNVDQVQQVQHIACLAVLAMCARSVAATEFETSPEVGQVRITVCRPDGAEVAGVDVEFVNANGFPLGGMSV